MASESCYHLGDDCTNLLRLKWKLNGINGGRVRNLPATNMKEKGEKVNKMRDRQAAIFQKKKKAPLSLQSTRTRLVSHEMKKVLHL